LFWENLGQEHPFSIALHF